MSNLSPEENELLTRVKRDSASSLAQAKESTAGKTALQRLTLKRKSKKRSLYGLAIGLIITGLVLVVFFNMFMAALGEQLAPFGYVDAMGPTFEGMPEWEAVFGGPDANLYEAYKAFYDSRWLVSGLIITAFTLLGAIALIAEVARRNKNE